MPDHALIDPSLDNQSCDGWLIYDYRGSNPVFRQMLGHDFMLSRRTFLLFTKGKRPRLLVSRVDYTESMPTALSDFAVDRYTTWGELDDWLKEHVGILRTVAMEYSPDGVLPNMSWVDGGTLDLIRAYDCVVVSSAELFQEAAARWTEENLSSHNRAMGLISGIKDAAFDLVADRLRHGQSCDERLVQKFIEDSFARHSLVTDDPPIVSVNSHSGDPHYAPSDEYSSPIVKGDWLLIDLWAKEDKPQGMFADITWVGYLGNAVPERHREVFDCVAAARDSVSNYLRNHPDVPGFTLDGVARQVIAHAGYGDKFVHRTGHSLSSGDSVHGLGANLDDYETHDTRKIVRGLGFTIEPGIYLDKFGVRSEINVYIAQSGPVITSPVQSEPLTFDL